MKYKLIIFDIDGTITKHISSWQLIHEKLNFWNDEASKYQDKFLAGKISYKRFCELDAACWKGINEKKIIRLFRPIEYSKNAKKYIKQLKRDNFKLAAVSTGLQYIPDIIKDELELDYVLANRLLSRKGILTGRVQINISHNAKGKTVKEILKRFNLKPHQSIGIGDTEGDISLAKNTGYSIGFNCRDKALAKIVDYNCKSTDFKELYEKIIKIAYNKSYNLNR